MTAPLAVKLRTPDGQERMITRELDDLRYTSKMRGGYATAEAPISRDVSLPGVPEFSGLTVYDTRSGRVMWDGRLLEPARSVSANGQQAQLSAIGEGPASTKDRKTPYMLVDSDLSSWEMQTATRKELNVRVASSPGSSDPALTFEGRGTVTNGDQAIAWYRNLYRCNQRIGAIGFTHIAGENTTGSDRAVDLRVGDTPQAASTVLFSYPWSTSLATRFVAFTPTTWPNATTPKLAFRYGASGPVADTSWSSIRSVAVYARLLGRDRQPLQPGAYTTGMWLKAEDVFTDVLARFCPRLDIENARVAAGTFNFTQLAWPSGITPAKVLDEILDMEPGMTWAVWERQSNGRYRTELRMLPTSVRYEATAQDGWASPNPTSDTYDSVAVRWRDTAGEDQVTYVTSVAPALAAAGLGRSTTIDLGSEAGTESQASQRGAAFLADHQVPPSGGKLTVARPLWDRVDGRWVMPWEIRPGELVRVRGIYSNPNALNATSPDGVTVARIVETSFSLSSMSASLDLDTPALSEQRLIAQLTNARTRG